MLTVLSGRMGIPVDTCRGSIHPRREESTLRGTDSIRPVARSVHACRGVGNTRHGVSGHSSSEDRERLCRSRLAPMLVTLTITCASTA